MVAASARRVAQNTPEHVNQMIRRKTEMNIAYYSRRPDQIDQRLVELDREWDIERAVEANAATLAFFGTAMGTLVNRKWLVLPVIVTGFLFQHAVQGWCPPVSVLRRLSVRTRREIDSERYALKALRGDFSHMSSGEDFHAVLQAVEQ